MTRKERSGHLSAADATSAVALFQHDYANRLRPVEITAALIGNAMTVARTHGLRGYDAVQLAAAIQANHRRVARKLAPLVFVTADTFLLAASAAEGLTTDNPYASIPQMWNDTDIPLAYLITFRCYGTWLHGDERGSIDRFHNRYQSPYLPPNERWHQYNTGRLTHEPVTLTAAQRESVETAIRETCALRHWRLRALNVRTNHAHVLSPSERPTRGSAQRFQSERHQATAARRSLAATTGARGRTKAAKGICGTSAVLSAPLTM